MKSFLITTVSILSLSFVSYEQQNNSCADFRNLIKTTYNFKPARLSEKEQDIKIAAMDKVWNSVKANPKELLPCLRNLLEDTNTDQFFRFDGSNLLVSLDPSSSSKSLQIRNCAAVDMDDVDLRYWVTTLSHLGVEGFDTSEAGSKWLSYPNGKYFLPEHGAYEITAFQGALFIFGSMDESHATPALIRIVSQKNHPGREHALFILMTLVTPEAIRALKELNPVEFSARTQRGLRAFLNGPRLLEPRSNPKISREKFLESFREIENGNWDKFFDLVEEVPDGEKDAVAVLKPEDILLVRKVRRIFISKGNQHAIEYYKSFTDILMALIWKPELVR